MMPSTTGTPRPKSTPLEVDTGHRDEEKTFAAKTFRLLTLGTMGMACLIVLLPAAGHDPMWGLYMARLVRHGAKLYGPEIFESNPPLFVWLSLLPSALAEWLHLPDTAVGKALVLGIETGVAAVCVRLLRRLWGAELSKSVLWALAFVYVAVFAVMPARDFGQRDHILVLLCLPYVLATAMDAEGIAIPRWVGLATGLAAGLGLALKPHEVLVPVAVEATVIFLRSKRVGRFALRSLLRPAPLVIVGCGIAYVAAIRLFAADYFTQVVPVLRETYWAFGHLSWWQLVRESAQLHILAIVVLAAFFAEEWRRASALVTLLIAAGIASTLAYYAQGTGWYYQQIPALSFFALALTFLSIDTAERLRWEMPRWAPGAAGGLCALALALTTHFAGYPFTEARSFPIDVPDASFFAGLAPGTPVATLTTTVDYTIPPIFRYRLTLAQRYPHLVLLPAILRVEDGRGRNDSARMDSARLAGLEAYQQAAMREDFARWKPQLVLVERCQDPAVHCQVLEDRHDDLLEWFLRDPGFRAEFAGYRYLRSVGSFDAYVPK